MNHNLEKQLEFRVRLKEIDAKIKKATTKEELSSLRKEKQKIQFEYFKR